MYRCTPFSWMLPFHATVLTFQNPQKELRSEERVGQRVFYELHSTVLKFKNPQEKLRSEKRVGQRMF